MKKMTLSLFLAACAAPAPRVTPTAPANSVVAAPRVVDTKAEPILAAPPRAPLPPWSKEPETNGELFTWLDGDCRKLDVSIVSETPFAHWGEGNHVNIARFGAEAISIDPKLSNGKAIPNHVHRLVGTLPDHLYLEGDNGGRCSFNESAVRWSNDAWTNAFALPAGLGVKDVKLYMGGALGLRTCSGCGDEAGSACVEDVPMGDNAKAPPIAGDGFRVRGWQSLDDGTIFAVGAVCKDANCNAQFRWWKPGGKVGFASAGTGSGQSSDVLVRSPTEVYFSIEGYFGLFDGAKVTRQPFPTKKTGRFVPLENGFAVNSDGKLLRHETDGSFTDITPPKFGAASVTAGFDKGAPWMIGEKGVVQKQVDGVWKEVPLPAPAFAASPKSYLTPERILVLAKDDVIIVASYAELHSGWLEAEHRRVILRTKRPRETLRCEGDAVGLRSWPATARADCQTPFVVLAKVSQTSPKDYDFPRTREIFKSRVPDIENGALVEVETEGKRWVGLVPKTAAKGDALVTLYAKAVSPMHPEMVCIAPPSGRSIPIVR